MGNAVGGHAWIVDTRNQDTLAPVGAIGELVIEGPILARGYLKKDEKTKEAFIENPNWAKGGDLRRMCKSSISSELILANSTSSSTRLGELWAISGS